MFSDVELKGYYELRRKLDPKVIDTAAKIAMNSAAAGGKAEAARQIYQRWNIKKRDINRALKALKTSRAGGHAIITVKGRPMSLTYFGAKWHRGMSVMTRHKSTLRRRASGRSGVFVDIMRGGQTTHKPHAFIAAVRTKRADIHHIGVFERIPGSRMLSNPNKEAIVERKLITMASMFGQRTVMDPTIERVEEILDEEFPRLVSVLFGRK
jgi:hypothetical protein